MGKLWLSFFIKRISKWVWEKKSRVKTEKYKTFFILKEKEIRKVNKDGNEDIIPISYEVKCIASRRFMASSL